MADEVSIYNRALSHLGIATQVQSTTEDSNEANACRQFFADCRDELLADFTWPFATKTAALALVEEDPTVEWKFSYQYPEDCLKFQNIIGLNRNPTRDQRVPYLVQSNGDGGLLLFTDYQDLVNGTLGVYTMRVTDTSQWPALFVKAMGYLLASYIGARVTSGDPMKLADRSEKLGQMAKQIAQGQGVNEDQMEPLPESEFILARGIGDGVVQPANTFLNQFGQS